MNDTVNHPKHYTSHPSGVECIQITEHMNFCVGNAIKYLWRTDHKNGIEDLEKAVWYINREIARRKAEEAAHMVAIKKDAMRFFCESKIKEEPKGLSHWGMLDPMVEVNVDMKNLEENIADN